MKKMVLNRKRGDSSPLEWLGGYDYCLFRQDWDKAEAIYFNKDESMEILGSIMEGHILIHDNYSLLYCKTEKLHKIAPNFGCYSLVHDLVY